MKLQLAKVKELEVYRFVMLCILVTLITEILAIKIINSFANCQLLFMRIKFDEMMHAVMCHTYAYGSL